ncbi:alpha/beta fold hydrolase [Algivirga pacifica]|uniref:Alpha/beta fold hydrolase n=2 Tax=Algivirga pacifica TaxID=1162670 RepID=A0ABP9DB73_9BACT
MIPAYIMSAILGWRLYQLNTEDTPKKWGLRIAGYALTIIVLLIGWVLPMALPVFSLPEPRGPYSVGTSSIYVQTEQEEEITADPNDKRELLYKIWYPGDVDTKSIEHEPYVDTGSRAGFATKYGLPPTLLNYLDKVQTYVYPDIPVKETSFPVLIFSHGYGSKATGYYALLTELASQGYIIINMNHTYESLGVTLPDGRVHYFDYAYQQTIGADAMEVVGPIIDAFKNDLPYEERHPIVREAAKNYFEGRIQDRWANDMVTTLNLLEKWNTEGKFKHKLDLTRIGVFGHSVGGGAAGNVTLKDGRIKAAANLDGIQWGDKIDRNYSVPFLYVSADWPADHEDINAHIYKKKSTDYFYECTLLQSGHPNFMDIPFMIPIPSVAGTGAINPYLGMEIVTKLLTSFFDQHLKGDNSMSIQAVGEQYDLLKMLVHQGDSVRSPLDSMETTARSK